MTKILLIDLKMNYFLTGKYLLVTMPNKFTISNTQDISKTGKLVSFRSLARLYKLNTFNAFYLFPKKLHQWHEAQWHSFSNEERCHFNSLSSAYLCSYSLFGLYNYVEIQWHFHVKYHIGTNLTNKNLSRINHSFYYNKMNRSRYF